MSMPKKQMHPVLSSSRAPDQDGGPTIRQGIGGAKNPWVHTGHHWNLRVATYNVRSLLGDDRLIELEEELEGVEWDIIGLSEVRRQGEDSLTKEWTPILLYRYGQQKLGRSRIHHP